MAEKGEPLLGYSKFGSGRTPAWRPAALGAIVLAAIFGAIAAYFRFEYGVWWQAFIIFWIVTFPAWFGIAWVVVVDRLTLPGAVPNPERSVENQWWDRAAANSFWFLAVVLGLVTTVTAILNYWLISTVLTGVLLVFAATFGVCYFLEWRRGR